ncbi:MAG: hypothetical protein IJY04_10630 [Clostridia bacterium]|nr:hypothetical protein [Clostridia bacterium]
MLDICKKLFTAWNEAGVRYCHWKSNEHLEEGLDGLTDLDIYVVPEDREKAEALLTASEYLKFIPQKGARYPNVDEWIGFDYATGALVHVHQHYQIITGTKFTKEYVFPIDGLLTDTRVIDGETGVYIAAPEVEIIILYCRIALKATDKKHIKPDGDYQKEIDYLKERMDSDKVRENCTVFAGINGAELYSLIEKTAPTEAEWYRGYLTVHRLLKKYKKTSSFNAKLRKKYFIYRSMWNAAKRKYLHITPIKRKTPPAGGMSICFIGADGSGKSTVSIDIKKWLNWKIEAERFYLGSGDHYNGIVKRLLAKGKSKSKGSSAPEAASEGNVSSDKPKAKRKLSLKGRLLRFGFNILQCVYLRQIAERSLKELKRAKKYEKKGGIALFDRFPQNQFEGMYDGPKIRCRYPDGGVFVRSQAKREERAIVKAQKYQPALTFKLLLPPEESVRRKPDHTIEEVAPKAAITEKLVFENSTVVDIDATQPYDSELLEIKRKIWAQMLKNNVNKR